MRRNPGRGGWREAAKRAGRPRELPVAALLGLGVAMPICLLAAGVYAIAAEKVAIPGAASFSGARDPALDHSSGVLTGPVADGFGIGLMGLAILLHCYLVWRRVEALRGRAGSGILAGCLVVASGAILALLG